MSNYSYVSLLLMVYICANPMAAFKVSPVIEGWKYLIWICINLELSWLLISLNHFMTTLVFFCCWYLNFSGSDEFVFSIIFLLIFPILPFVVFKVDILVWIKNSLYDPLVLCVLGISLNSLFCHEVLICLV